MPESALADSWVPSSNQKIPVLVCPLNPQCLGCALLLAQGGCHGKGANQRLRSKCRIQPRALVVAKSWKRKNMTSWGPGGLERLGVGLELKGSGEGQRLLRKGKKLKAKTSQVPVNSPVLGPKRCDHLGYTDLRAGSEIRTQWCGFGSHVLSCIPHWRGARRRPGCVWKSQAPGALCPLCAAPAYLS